MKVQRTAQRADAIFAADFRAVTTRVDRMFFWLLIGQWLFAIGIALVWSPRTWIAQYWSIHQHLIAAATLGGLFAAYPLFCIWRQPGRRWTRHMIAIGQMLQSALLAHVSGGRIETHFHVFGSLALLAFYRDWRVLITASTVVYLDHVALGFWFPLSAYGVVEASFWRSAEHAFWVVFEVVFLIMSCHRGLEELRAIADRQAEIEIVAADLRRYNAEIESMSGQLKGANEALETRVLERTESLSREVGERRQAEAALSAQTRVLQSILNNMGEAVIVADSDGKFVLVNPAAQRLVGVPLVDGPWQEWADRYGTYLPDRSTRCPSDQLPLVQAMRGGSCDQIELFVRNPAHCDGLFVSCNARPIRDEHGSAHGGVVVFHDITSRKRAEEALAERARLSNLTADVAMSLTRDTDLRVMLRRCCDALLRHLDAALVRIWIVDKNQAVLETQGSAGLDVALEIAPARTPLGKFPINRVVQDRKPFVTDRPTNDLPAADSLIALVEGWTTFAALPLLVGENLVGVLALAAGRPLPDTARATLAAVADNIALGIERFQAKHGLVQAQEAKVMAEAANQAKSEFLSRMSHELRTPLNAILGFGQLLGMHELSGEQSECVEQITRGGKHLLALINEVLDIARIEAGRMEISPEPVRVADAFQEALDLVQPLAARRDIQLGADLEGANGFHVLADNQKLKQVLLNLISNAVKYNHDGGTVRLMCETAGLDRVRLTVEDTGCGIAPEKLARLFMPFERLGAEQTGIEGSGLGLALSKSLVELMRGRLSAASRVGVGSRFCVELDRVDDPQETLGPELESVPSVPSAANEEWTVLYVEDNLDNLRLVQRILAHRPGVQLLTAMQGRLGLDLATQHCPDLILLDVHLPDLSGEEVLRRLKTDPRTQAIPTVVISADATTRQIERLRMQGASVYLTKPIDIPRLLEVVDAHLRKAVAVP